MNADDFHAPKDSTVEPDASDYLDARDSLEESADILGEFLRENAEEFATFLFHANERFRERACVRFEGWLHNKAREIAEAREQRRLEQE